MANNLKNFLIYRKIIKNRKKELKKLYNISFDWVFRMYKTYTIPKEELEAVKNLGSDYLDKLLKNEIKRVDEYFLSIGLSELVGLMEVIELNETQIGIAFRYKYLNTAKIASRIIWWTLATIFAISGFLLFSFLGIGVGLLSISGIYLFTRLLV